MKPILKNLLRSHARAATACLLCATILVCLSSAAAYAQDGDDKCERGLMVRNQLERPGIVPGPARLALQHTAGERSFALADIAIFSGRACAGAVNNSFLDYGLEYHLNQSAVARMEKAAAVFSYTRTSYDIPETAGGEAGSQRSVQYFLKFGRDIENNGRTTHVGANFSAFEFAGNDGSSGKKQGTGWLGGQFKRPDNGAAFEYQIIPGLEYFAGYQPEDIEDRLEAGYAGATARWTWSPFPRSRKHLQGVYVSAEWTGRRRLWGDELLPRSANLTTVGVGYSFTDESLNYRKSKISLALDFEKGRDPENGFMMDETFFLALKYSLDRQN
jgi:hypothetical protein